MNRPGGGSGGSKPCTNFTQSGFCNYGDKCKFVHPGKLQTHKPQPRPKPQKDTLCNFFIQGNCQRGDTCNNIHQYSLDFDVDGRLFETSKKVQEAISMEIYEFDMNQGTIVALVCTTQFVYLTLLPNGQAQEITKINGITAMNYDKDNKLLFIAYNNKE